MIIMVILLLLVYSTTIASRPMQFQTGGSQTPTPYPSDLTVERAPHFEGNCCMSYSELCFKELYVTAPC